MHRARTLALVALATAASAQTTVPVFLPFFDPQGIDASVVGADANAATFVLACPAGVAQDECGIAVGALAPTIIQGPNTYEIHLTAGGLNNIDATCEFSGDSAYCTEVLAGNTAIESIDGISASFLPVTVTAGAQLLTAVQTTPAATEDAGQPTSSAAAPGTPDADETASSAADDEDPTAPGSDPAPATATPPPSDAGKTGSSAPSTTRRATVSNSLPARPTETADGGDENGAARGSVSVFALVAGLVGVFLL